MTGNCALFFGSNIGFDPCLEFLPWAERDDAPCADWNLLAGLGISAGALVLVAQIKVAEAREFHLLSTGQCRANFLEEEIHQLARFTLVQTELVEQRFRHLRFRQGHFFILEFSRSDSYVDPPPRRP